MWDARVNAKYYLNTLGHNYSFGSIEENHNENFVIYISDWEICRIHREKFAFLYVYTREVYNQNCKIVLQEHQYFNFSINNKLIMGTKTNHSIHWMYI